MMSVLFIKDKLVVLLTLPLPQSNDRYTVDTGFCDTQVQSMLATTEAKKLLN